MLNKILLNTMLLIAFATNSTIVFANNALKNTNLPNDYFIGMSSGKLIFSLSDPLVDGATYRTKFEDGYTSITAGKNVGRSQIYTTLNQFNGEADLKISNITMGFDTLLSGLAISPFAGVSVGYMSWQETGLINKNTTFSITEDNTIAKDTILLQGFTYGIKFGVLYSKADFDFKLGYEVIHSNANDTVFFSGESKRFELTSLQLLTFNVNYKF